MERLNEILDNMKVHLLCTICEDMLKDCRTIINCGHHFCSECISIWLNTKSTCPTCGGTAGMNNLKPNNEIINYIKGIKRTIQASEIIKEKIKQELDFNDKSIDHPHSNQNDLKMQDEDKLEGEVYAHSSLNEANEEKLIEIQEKKLEQAIFPPSPPNYNSNVIEKLNFMPTTKRNSFPHSTQLTFYDQIELIKETKSNNEVTIGNPNVNAIYKSQSLDSSARKIWKNIFKYEEGSENDTVDIENNHSQQPNELINKSMPELKSSIVNDRVKHYFGTGTLTKGLEFNENKPKATSPQEKMDYIVLERKKRKKKYNTNNLPKKKESEKWTCTECSYVNNKRKACAKCGLSKSSNTVELDWISDGQESEKQINKRIESYRSEDMTILKQANSNHYKSDDSSESEIFNNKHIKINEISKKSIKRNPSIKTIRNKEIIKTSQVDNHTYKPFDSIESGKSVHSQINIARRENKISKPRSLATTYSLSRKASKTISLNADIKSFESSSSTYSSKDLSKKWNLNNTTIYVSFSGFNSEFKKNANKLLSNLNKKGLKIKEVELNFSTKRITHLITFGTEIEDKIVVQRKIKWLISIIKNLHIVSYQWLEDSLEQGEYLNEKEYYTYGSTAYGPLDYKIKPLDLDGIKLDLFKGYTFCLKGEFKKLNKTELENLIKLAEGQIVKRNKEEDSVIHIPDLQHVDALNLPKFKCVKSLNGNNILVGEENSVNGSEFVIVNNSYVLPFPKKGKILNIYDNNDNKGISINWVLDCLSARSILPLY